MQERMRTALGFAVAELKRRVERLEATTQGEKHDRDSTSQ